MAGIALEKLCWGPALSWIFAVRSEDVAGVTCGEFVEVDE